jgi:hypothetical protein
MYELYNQLTSDPVIYNFNILIFFRKTDQLSGSKFDRGDPVILLKTCTIL